MLAPCSSPLNMNMSGVIIFHSGAKCCWVYDWVTMHHIASGEWQSYGVLPTPNLFIPDDMVNSPHMSRLYYQISKRIAENFLRRSRDGKSEVQCSPLSVP